ncbi:winged helix-turn-helix transcriptional regulator [Kibdelosporangium phytohabitans]|uniref:HxlR family transcriptional regulator n=1 Tax=Kibdelosporangium phytohabitans TaxID=860235 RepID=A0A0N9I8F3_9PSEU|nr:helix-turn-helix domain-containing protein [Kibdelosporangium phytohabitans]ALG10779.1 HxlR family transcriptional regulator [Kibdelosporangium phytohabitans]MBE1461939.1 DNA-binding HxlR family transcriptional regulator [Kibdelosporangium phytohabitans]
MSGATVLEPGGPNAIAVTNGIVGDEWTLWIVQLALTDGLTLYNEWLNAGPISNAVLSARLNRLVQNDILTRSDRRYRLTGRGRQLWPVLLSMWAWEQRWVDPPDGRLPGMRHTRCGRTFSPLMSCEACDGAADVRDVRGRFGPSGDWPRSIPTGVTRRRAHTGHRPAELIPQTMSLIGNRWSTALLGAAFLGATRFGEFEQRMGAPPTVVADRLRTFCDLQVLAAAPNPERRDWMVYRLTAKGRAFFPVVATAIEWGQRWYTAPEGPALRLTHTQCGRAFHPRLRCSDCGERLRGASVQVVRGRDERLTAG